MPDPVPAVGEPYASLAELKSQLTVAYTGRDSILSQKLAAATTWVNRFTGRTFWLDEEPSMRVFNPTRRIAERPDGQLLLVDDIGSDPADIVVETGTTGSWTALGPADFETSPDNSYVLGQPVTGIFRPYGWVVGVSSRIRITAAWGWPAIPDAVVEATLLKATRLYSRKDAPQGVISNEWGSARVPRIDVDVANLLASYKLVGAA